MMGNPELETIFAAFLLTCPDRMLWIAALTMYREDPKLMDEMLVFVEATGCVCHNAKSCPEEVMDTAKELLRNLQMAVAHIQVLPTEDEAVQDVIRILEL